LVFKEACSLRLELLNFTGQENSGWANFCDVGQKLEGEGGASLYVHTAQFASTSTP
jgi:hypothetical protein